MQKCCALVVAILLIGAGFVGGTARAYDFYGNDIAAFDNSSPDDCASRCRANADCRAWTVVRDWNNKCFLKNPVPNPSWQGVCPTNEACTSGLKVDGKTWCGDNPSKTIGGSGVQGQGQVVTCPAGQSCLPERGGGAAQLCWFLFIPYPCRSEYIETIDWYCQGP